MYRATTPVHSFVFSTDPAQFEKILITYAHAKENKIILEKTEDDLTFSQETTDAGETKYIASLQLTQEEANLFHTFYGEMVFVQVRVKQSNGTVLASDKKTLYVKDVLNDEVL